MRGDVMFAHPLLAVFAALTADPPPLPMLAPRACGVALAEVVAAEPFDSRKERPSSGWWKGVRYKLARVRGTGEFVDTVTVVTESGGHCLSWKDLHPSAEPEEPYAPVVGPASLQKGKRYWFAFAPYHAGERVIRFWPDGDPKAGPVLEAAVKEDALRWRPQYDPETGLTYGHLAGAGSWRVRVWRDAKLVCEHEFPGARAERSGYSLYLGNIGSDFDPKPPPCGKFLVAVAEAELAAGNEFGVKPGRYWLQTATDPETGRRYVVWVALPQVSSVQVVGREYDPATGHPRVEHRYAHLETGGKAAGAATEDWYRRTARTFDPATGKLIREEVFRYVPNTPPAERWAKVGK